MRSNDPLPLNLVASSGQVYIRPMQTALHIAALVAELKAELEGGRIVATEFYKKLRTALFVVQRGRERHGLALVYHPAGSGCFCVPVSKIKLDTTEKPWPIFGLDNAEVTGIVQPHLDRIFEMKVTRDGVPCRILFEALGPNGNVWLLDQSGGKSATLRNRKFTPGEVYQAPETGDRIGPYDISGDGLLARMRQESNRSAVAVLKGVLLGFNDTLAREALVRARIHSPDSVAITAEQADALAKAITQVASRFEVGHAGYLYTFKGGIEVYPFRLESTDIEPEKFRTLSLATMEMVNRRQTVVSEVSEEQRLLKAVSGAIKRHERLVHNIELDIAKAADYGKYKRIGELLQLHRDRLRKGLKTISVEDILDPHRPTVHIDLDPAAGPQENIDEYFRRHRKGREGLDLLRRRGEIAGQELEALRKMLTELETDFESAQKQYHAELQSLLPREAPKRETQPRLPYREARLSTGLTIYIGRDGADNDRTTFDFAKPYELWFHTQQCPGSHVVMKYPNKSFAPSKREIEETAAIAAWHSKARHDSLVAVAYTERRYVRKPRNAKPGLVTVEREKSVMVVPQKEHTSGK
ncbi:MAG: NFACT RNA binding domain-containing protein [Candidatus Zixiibacteriota bacterium]